MAVAILNVGAENHNSTAAGTIDSGNFSFAGGDADKLLIVFLGLQDQAATPTCVIDPAGVNLSMTLLGSIATTGTVCKAHIFGYLGPPTLSSVPARATWSGTTQAFISAMALTGVDQGSLAASALFSSLTGTQTSGPTNPPSLDISSATNNLTAAVCVEDSTSPTISVTSQTSWAITNAMSQGYASSQGVGNSTNTHSFGLSGSGTYHWAIAGLNIIAVGQAGGGGDLSVNSIGEPVIGGSTF